MIDFRLYVEESLSYYVQCDKCRTTYDGFETDDEAAAWAKKNNWEVRDGRLYCSRCKDE